MEEEIRCVIHFLYLKGTSVPSSVAQINSVYGPRSISRSGVRYWFNEFKRGRTSVKTLDRSGRPANNEKTVEIRSILEDMPYASARYISEELNLNRSVVTRILKIQLGLQKRHLRWVPHNLTDEQKVKRVELSKSMLKTLSSLSENQRAAVITGDESWFYLSYPYDSKWCEPNETLPDISKRLINDEKVMIFVAFNCQGLVYLNVMPTNSILNSAYMCEHILKELSDNANQIIKKYTKHQKILHIDNARPHTAKRTQEKIQELGWKQPPYSLDISPCDFFLFG